MEFNQEIIINSNYIHQYIPGEHLIVQSKDLLSKNQLSKYTTNILIYGEEIITNWLDNNSNINNIKPIQLDYILKAHPEIVIFGTGAKQIFPKDNILHSLIDQQIPHEIMSSNSACKTFNILRQEGRDVLLAIII